ncbi:unnamed protein product [Candidula unifasciata]|uniref:Uncharacterized protein n=1 Tax=Candidula unifasciata TaxID=100452 RepID=A0A8S3YSC2_9EUPU|nr:unnamed protein product [Candidula unifasciata]
MAPPTGHMRRGDDDFMGRQDPEIICYPVPIHLAQQQPPWKELSGQFTLNSARQNAYHFDPSAPCDDLDFVIKSSYDHQRDLFKDKKEVLRQAEVYDEQHGHIFVNRIKKLPTKKMPLNHPLIITCQAKKENTDSIKTLLGGTHIHATRQGYSRKPHTGGFFLTS